MFNCNHFLLVCFILLLLISLSIYLPNKNHNDKLIEEEYFSDDPDDLEWDLLINEIIDLQKKNE